VGAATEMSLLTGNRTVLGDGTEMSLLTGPPVRFVEDLMVKFDQNLSLVLTFLISILGTVGKLLNEAIGFNSSEIFGALLVILGRRVPKGFSSDHVMSGHSKYCHV
jgi:hypothetical protein